MGYMFGISDQKPSLEDAKRRDRIARRHGGNYIEVNRKKNAAPGINHGSYQGWYDIPNHGNPFDQETAADILQEVGDR